jgi:solute carrier family 25 (mitochondrial oxoglutarate transporter), member 11
MTDVSRTVSFASSGLGGVIAWVIIHPANTVGVRMNLQRFSAGVPETNFIRYSKAFIAKEGVAGLYDGLSAGITRQLFYATSRMGLFELFRDKLATVRKTDFLSRLLVGVASGGCAAFIACPAEVTLVRLSTDKTLPIEQRRNYSGFLDAVRQITKNEGILTFWRGSIPLINRAMVVGATQVGTYDQFRDIYANYLNLPRSSFTNVAAASMTAGLIYSILSMPFEAVKNRMAFQKKVNGELVYKSLFQSLRLITKTEGFFSLYVGFLPYYLRCGGHTVGMFIAIEQIRNMYKRSVAK